MVVMETKLVNANINKILVLPLINSKELEKVAMPVQDVQLDINTQQVDSVSQL